jgi:F-type H+-transporting ATPase subunit delta
MRPDAISRRYARALFALADGQGVLDQVGAALSVAGAVVAEPLALRVLTGPLPRERKRDLLLKIVEATNAPGLVRDFFLLLAEVGRLKHLPAIRAVFEQLLDARQGVSRATIRSAAAVSSDVLEDVVRVFTGITGKRVVAQVEIVPDLIAGMIVEVEGRVYDGSLRTQLGKLHQQMATGS